MKKGTKHDAEKPRWDLLPFGPLALVVDVLTHGAREYTADNWQSVESPRRRYFAALMRHLSAWQQGERLDPGSKLPHLAHVATNVMFLLWFEAQS